MRHVTETDFLTTSMHRYRHGGLHDDITNIGQIERIKKSCQDRSDRVRKVSFLIGLEWTYLCFLSSWRINSEDMPVFVDCTDTLYSMTVRSHLSG